MIGKVLGNRYEIIEKIGTGGMSVVYKAKCKLLNRFVAIKILRQEFIDNDEFIKRFKIEAQAAASLSHPNVVSIYDVGSQDDFYYIVMEYVDGVTLKEYIVYKKVLEWKESIKIAVQICSALEHAHKNGIVHRDIKPHNIIITTDGVVKVTDFGIARAATFFTVTFAGNAIGSVHYFSPEQARGGYTDNKSDIYSLGVVMYEMVMGTVPFEGDTPVAIAFKHIQQNAISPKELNDAIPIAINNIILKAMSKEVEKRYQNATSMLRDLNEALKRPNEDFVDVVQQEDDKGDSPTLVIPAINVPKNINETKNEGNMANTSDKATKTKKKLKLYGLIFASIIVIAIASFFITKYAFNSTSDLVAVVPSLVGKTEEQAMDILSKAHLTMVIKGRKADETVPFGTIIEQSPGSGMSVKIPNDVSVTVSSGKKEVQIPSVEKKDYREAQVEIEKIGLVTKISYESSETIPIGFVTKLNPSSGTMVKQGTTVEIFVSNGPSSNSFPMPNLIGMTEQKAKTTLQDNKLVYGQTTYVNNSAAYGNVVNQSIQSNTAVTEGTKVDLKLSTGKSSQTIKIALPQDKPTVTVEARIINSKGVATVIYPKKVLNSSQSPLTITVSGQGKAHLEVFFDGKLGSEQDITF